MRDHLPDCVAWSLAERYPGERPDSITPEDWATVRIAWCAPGCAVLDRDIERGKELAAQHGW